MVYGSVRGVYITQNDHMAREDNSNKNLNKNAINGTMLVKA